METWVAIASPVIVGVLAGGLNLWANNRVSEERDRGHEQALLNLTNKLDTTSTDMKQTLANFGQRLGGMQEEVIRLQAGLGMGGDHGLFSEVRDMRRALDELRRAADSGINAVASRVSAIESQAMSNADRLKRLEEDRHA